jgi:hypothetical protein
MIPTTTFGVTAEPFGPAAATAAPPEFSLVAGGPLYRMMCRLKLADSALGQLNRGILVAFLIAWVPAVGRETVLRLLIFPLIPVAPLALTLVPLDRLVKHLISALF